MYENKSKKLTLKMIILAVGIWFSGPKNTKRLYENGEGTKWGDERRGNFFVDSPSPFLALDCSWRCWAARITCQKLSIWEEKLPGLVLISGLLHLDLFLVKIKKEKRKKKRKEPSENWAWSFAEHSLEIRNPLGGKLI